MKTDNNPSAIFGLYSKPDKKQELLAQLKKLGVGVREISFIDVEIPPERKDEIINFFKHFVLCDYWVDRNPLNKDIKFFGIDLKEKLVNKIGYKPIKIKRGDFRPDTRHPLIWTLAVPLVYQDTSEQASNDKEKQAIKDIETFTSKDYKPIIDGEVKPENMEILEDDIN